VRLCSTAAASAAAAVVAFDDPAAVSVVVNSKCRAVSQELRLEVLERNLKGRKCRHCWIRWRIVFGHISIEIVSLWDGETYKLGCGRRSSVVMGAWKVWGVKILKVGGWRSFSAVMGRGRRKKWVCKQLKSRARSCEKKWGIWKKVGHHVKESVHNLLRD